MQGVCPRCRAVTDGIGDGGNGRTERLMRRRTRARAVPRGTCRRLGRYPILVAEALKRQGCHAYCLGVAGHADPVLAQTCHDFSWIGLGQLGRAIRYFRRHQVAEATMAGKFHKALLFRRWAWIRHLPDLRTLRAVIPHFLTRTKDCKDDTLLGMLVDEFAADGIHFGPATDYVPELLVKRGQLTQRAPADWQWKDIRFGWQIAKELGRLDIGQSVAVKNQAVLAVEAIEGTDQCIRRAGTLCQAGEFTIVKVAKPQQDMRFDVPTIGLGTLESMVESGARVAGRRGRPHHRHRRATGPRLRQPTPPGDRGPGFRMARRVRRKHVALTAVEQELPSPACGRGAGGEGSQHRKHEVVVGRSPSTAAASSRQETNATAKFENRAQSPVSHPLNRP